MSINKMQEPVLIKIEDRIGASRKEKDRVVFRLESSPLTFYLYEEDCLQRYSKCLHWITQQYPRRWVSVTAFTTVSRSDQAGNAVVSDISVLQ